MIEEYEKNRLVFRRQYIIAPYPIECPFLHHAHKLSGNGFLYTHLDLKVTKVLSGRKQVILLGDIFDHDHTEYKNDDILGDIAQHDFPEVLAYASRYSGRFVIIYLDPATFTIFTDATASRKVYYCYEESKFWCGSQPHLIAKILGYDRTKNPSMVRFYNSEDFVRLCYSNVGDTTPYDAIKQLIPNHYLSVNQGKPIRFWPDKQIQIQPLEDVAEKCATILKGTMEAITARYEVMLPVTAGYDSRMLMAATRTHHEHIFYYLNQERHLTERHNDIRIPRKIFATLNMDFHVLKLEPKIDKDFEKIYLFNNPTANKEYLPHIFTYYKWYSHKVNLPGNFAAATWGINRLKEEKISAENLAYLYRLSSYDYALDYNRKWLDECSEPCFENNVNPITLYYWEERIANWGTQIQLDKDIAQEDINPLNSRLIIEQFLSVKREYHNAPDHILHKRIIERLWPQLNNFPYNPGCQRTFLTAMKKAGLLNLVLKIRYKHMR